MRSPFPSLPGSWLGNNLQNWQGSKICVCEDSGGRRKGDGGRETVAETFCEREELQQALTATVLPAHYQQLSP